MRKGLREEKSWKPRPIRRERAKKVCFNRVLLQVHWSLHTRTVRHFLRHVLYSTATKYPLAKKRRGRLNLVGLWLAESERKKRFLRFFPLQKRGKRKRGSKAKPVPSFPPSFLCHNSKFYGQWCFSGGRGEKEKKGKISWQRG